MRSRVLKAMLALSAAVSCARAQIVDTVLDSGVFEPQSLAVAGDNLYISDSGNHRIAKYLPDTGILTNVAGLKGQSGMANGSGTFARFFDPKGIVFTRGGLVVSDSANHVLRFVTLNGTVTNLVGESGVSGNADGPSDAAAFWYPAGLATDDAGNIYVADTFNDSIRMVDTNNNVSTLGKVFLADNPSMRFSRPAAVAVADGGRVLVADTGKHSVKLIEADGTVRLLGGGNSTRASGSADSLIATSARFRNPTGLLWLDSSATGILVSDTANHVIRRLFFNAEVGDYSVETFAGTVGESGLVNGALSVARFTLPAGLGRDPLSGFLVVDQGNHAIRRIQTTAPQPPVANPQIGWVDFVADPNTGALRSVLVPVSQGIFNNDVIIAILPSEPDGIVTSFTSGATPTNILNDTIPSPSSKVGQQPAKYRNGLSPEAVPPTLLTAIPDLTVKAISFGESTRRPSQVVQARFQFRTANPQIVGDNPASFVVRDITTDSQLYYTTDGSDPTNSLTNPAVTGPLASGAKISLPPLSSNLLFKVQAFRASYQPSAVVSNLFTPTNFVANRITFGFDGGEASSDFVAAAGQRFYAPVGLTLLPGASMYSLQFNLAVTNLVGPEVAPGDIGFESMLYEKDIDLSPPAFFLIPPAAFITFVTQGTNRTAVFTNLLTTNITENLLSVGWLETFGKVNLYNTFNQDLVSYSRAHNTLFEKLSGKMVVGAYMFGVPTNAVEGSTYRIQIGRPSATEDGVSADVFIQAPTNGSLAGGAINSIKHVTVGVRQYLVGDAAPFRWFNAGDFGDTNLLNNDISDLFQAALYGEHAPPAGSDFFDAMDSSNGTTNNFVASDGNDTVIDTIMFGDGSLNVDDVFVTFRRSLDPNLKWFARYWSNGVREAVEVPNRFRGAANQPATSFTITNTGAEAASSEEAPFVRFSADQVRIETGSTVNVPIRASIRGAYPLRVLMMNLKVEAMSGSPRITDPVRFIPSAALGNPTLAGAGFPNNFAGAWLTPTAAITGESVIGTLVVTLPPGTTADSQYAVHFEHASGSPNGIGLFPKEVQDGAINVATEVTTLVRVNGAREGVAAVLRWTAAVGKKYRVEVTSDLVKGVWSTAQESTAESEAMQFRSENQTSGNQFFRVRVVE